MRGSLRTTRLAGAACAIGALALWAGSAGWRPLAAGLVAGLAASRLLAPRRAPGSASIDADASAGRPAAPANYDAETGLPCRARFLERLARDLVSAKVRGDHVAVLAIQLGPGPGAGGLPDRAIADEGLQRAAQRLARELRGRDLLGAAEASSDAQLSRVGHNDFCVAIPKIRDLPDAGRIARRLLAALEDALASGSRETPADAAIGVALFPVDGEDAASLLASAHGAAETARKGAAPRLHFLSAALRGAANRRYQLGTRLRGAVERGELMLHYQAIRHAQSGRVVAAETLLRWTDAELGPVEPGEFIPVAEETGQIEELGLWVLRGACAQYRRWRDAGLAPIRLSVNVSPRQIRRAGWVDAVAGALADFAVPPCDLELEITEGILLSDEGGRALAALAAIDRMGISIALDDFGTGHASISYLQQFPIRRLKIDRSFISPASDTVHSQAITRAILAMAQSLGLGTVAEGVETLAQAEHARAHGCQELQGSLFGEAEPPERFARHLEPEKGEPSA